MLVDIEDNLYEKVKKIAEGDDIRFSTIKQFVNLAVREKLEEMEDGEI